MATLDFADVERLQQGGWQRLATRVASAAQSLERGGADFAMLCTNTMHRLAESIAVAVWIPFLHIVDATPSAIKRSHQKRVGLLATKFYDGGKVLC